MGGNARGGAPAVLYDCRQPTLMPEAITAAPISTAVSALMRAAVIQLGDAAATQARIPLAAPTATAAEAMHCMHMS